MSAATRTASSRGGPPARGVARSPVSAVLAATLLSSIVPAAQAATGCPAQAPLVRHGPVERTPEPESGVLLRHALIGPVAGRAAAPGTPARDTAHRRELDSVLARIRTAWPDMAAVTARPLWEPGTLILELEPALGGAVAEALGRPGARAPFCTGHAGFDALNRKVGLRAVTAFPQLPHLVRIHFDPDGDVPGIGARYAALDGVVTATPDTAVGDGPGIQALRADGAWFLVFRDAWGDCPSGCLSAELHFFVADGRRIARVDDRDAVGMDAFSDILAARGWHPR